MVVSYTRRGGGGGTRENHCLSFHNRTCIHILCYDEHIGSTLAVQRCLVWATPAVAPPPPRICHARSDGANTHAHPPRHPKNPGPNAGTRPFCSILDSPTHQYYFTRTRIAIIWIPFYASRKDSTVRACGGRCRLTAPTRRY